MVRREPAGRDLTIEPGGDGYIKCRVSIAFHVRVLIFISLYSTFLSITYLRTGADIRLFYGFCGISHYARQRYGRQRDLLCVFPTV